MGKNGPADVPSSWRISLESTYFGSLLKMAKLSTSFCCLDEEEDDGFKCPESLLNELVSMTLTDVHDRIMQHSITNNGSITFLNLILKLVYVNSGKFRHINSD